jgi:hypothetical protein
MLDSASLAAFVERIRCMSRLGGCSPTDPRGRAPTKGRVSRSHTRDGYVSTSLLLVVPAASVAALTIIADCHS